MTDLEAVVRQFIDRDAFTGAKPYGEGHINDTYAACFRRGDGTAYRMLLQRINRRVFADPPGLMNNIYGVTQYLKAKIRANGGDVLRETLTVVPTVGGDLYYRDAGGDYWRMYLFVENAATFQSCRNDRDFYNCGAAFGKFQRLLAEYPTDGLIETIPDFHNTPKRLRDLKDAVRRDRAGRAAAVRDEIAFALGREKDAGVLTDLLERGIIPYRVTHNDTKLNNILIDDNTGEGVCVIDLDTVMPGAACFDFGDSIRFGASTAPEDETELGRVSMSLRLYEVFAEGYMSVAKEFLTEAERRSLPVGAIIMTLECGVRFLTDYLNGDTYFKIHRERQNLDRCRTQFALVADMERKMDRMNEIISRCC